MSWIEDYTTNTKRKTNILSRTSLDTHNVDENDSLSNGDTYHSETPEISQENLQVDFPSTPISSPLNVFGTSTQMENVKPSGKKCRIKSKSTKDIIDDYALERQLTEAVMKDLDGDCQRCIQKLG